MITQPLRHPDYHVPLKREVFVGDDAVRSIGTMATVLPGLSPINATAVALTARVDDYLGFDPLVKAPTIWPLS